MVARLTADTSGFYRGMAVANASMIRSGSIISRIAGGAGLAITAMGLVSIRAAANFQQSMNILQAVSNASTNDMGRLRAQAIALGKDFKLPNVSAKDAAEAMVQLSKAGLGTNDILSATRGVLQLGLAANLGFADSADIVARSLKMFNLGGDQATKIANLLAAGANASTASIGDLALGLQNAGGQFASAHMPIQDLVVALTELTDRGLSGELAGTALKTMMIRLESPTKKAAAVMKDLGVNIYDLQGRVLPLPNIIGQFQTAMKGASDQTKNQALNTIFGTRANQAMFKLIDAGTVGWQNYANRIVDTNAAQKMAEAQTKGLNGAMGALGSAFETLAIEIGTPFLGALEGAVRGMANFIASIDASKITGFVQKIVDLGKAFVDFVKSSEPVQGVLVAIAGGLAGLLIANEVIGAVRGLAGAMIALDAAMAANPILLVVAALAALAAAFVFAYMKSQTFRNIVNSAFAAIRTAVGPTIKQIVDTVRRNWQQISTETKQIWNQIKGVVTAILPYLNIYIKTLFANQVAIIKAALTIALSVIKTYIMNFLAPIRIFAALLRGDWSKAWSILAETAKQNLNNVKTVITATLTALKSVVGNIARGIGQAFTKALGSSFAKAKAAVSNAWNTVKSFLSGLPGTVGSIGAAIGNAFANGIVSAIKAAGNKIKAAGEWAVSQLKKLNPFSPVEEGGRKYVGEPFMEGAAKGLKEGGKKLSAEASKAVKEAAQKAAINREVLDAAKTIGINAARAVARGVTEDKGVVGQVHDALVEKIKEANEKAAIAEVVKKAARTLGMKAAQEIANGVTTSPTVVEQVAAAEAEKIKEAHQKAAISDVVRKAAQVLGMKAAQGVADGITKSPTLVQQIAKAEADKIKEAHQKAAIDATIARYGRILGEKQAQAIADGILKSPTVAQQIAQAEAKKITEAHQQAAIDAVVANAAKTLGAKQAQSIADGITKSTTTVQQIAKAERDAITRAHQVVQVDALVDEFAKKIGRKQAQGIADGILGGQPTIVEQAKKAMAEAAQKAADEAEKVAKEALTTKKKAFADAFSGLATAALAGFDAVVNAWVSPAQKLLDKINLQEQMKQLADSITKAKDAIDEANKSIAEATSQMDALKAAQDALASGKDPSEVIGMLPEKMREGLDKLDPEELKNKLADMFTKAQEAQQKGQEDLIKANEDFRVATLNQEKFRLEQLAAQQKTAHDKQIAVERIQFQNRLTQLQNWLEKHPGEYSKMHGKIMKLFKDFDLDYKKWGEEFGNALVLGLQTAEGKVEAAAANLAAVIRKYFPSSPAERGPMKDLDHWMEAFAPTLMKGVDYKTLNSLMQGGFATMGPGAQPGVGYAAGLRGATDVGTRSAMIVLQGNFIGTDMQRAAVELTPYVRRELNRVGFSNIGVGLS